MIFKTEPTSYGFRTTARGAVRAEDSAAWLDRLRAHLRSDQPTSFAILLDVRGLTFAAVSAEVAAVSALRRLAGGGLSRIGIVTESAAQLLEIRRLVQDGGIHERARVVAVGLGADAERTAERWAAEGVDESLPRLSERRAELALLVDALGEPLVLCDLQGRPLHANAALERLLAADPEQGRLRHELECAARAPLAARASRSAIAVQKERDVCTSTRSYRIRHVSSGEGLCTPAAAQLVSMHPIVSRPLTDDELRGRFSLTTREIEIARLLAGGATNAEIARSLGISPFTARNHTERILGKLGISNRARVAAVLLAA